MRGTVFIGLDVGTKTIGVARASSDGRLASPAFTLRRQGVARDVDRLKSALAGEVVEAWVVGLPFELDGSEARSARLARQVGEALAAATGRPVVYSDERFSTVEAAEKLRAAGKDARRQRAVIDQAAAAVILQGWLDGTGAGG